MYSLEEKTKQQLEDFKDKLTEETEARNKDVENIKKDMARLSQLPRGGGGAAAGPPIQLGPSKEDLEAVSVLYTVILEQMINLCIMYFEMRRFQCLVN